VNYSNEKAISLFVCGKHQNEYVNYPNEKTITQNEKAISLFACGKHQNEYVNYSNEKTIRVND